MGAANHPSLGQVVFTGSGARQERSSSKHIMAGQQFPTIKSDPEEQHVENKKAATIGFAKLTITPTTAKPVVQLIGTNQEILSNSQDSSQVKKPVLLKEIQKTVMNLLTSYIPLLGLGRHHVGRMERLIKNIRQAKELTTIKALIQADYKGLLEALKLTPTDQVPDDKDLAGRTLTIAAKAYQNPTQGKYLETLHQALVYLSTVTEKPPETSVYNFCLFPLEREPVQKQPVAIPGPASMPPFAPY